MSSPREHFDRPETQTQAKKQNIQRHIKSLIRPPFTNKTCQLEEIFRGTQNSKNVDKGNRPNNTFAFIILCATPIENIITHFIEVISYYNIYQGENVMNSPYIFTVENNNFKGRHKK